MAVGKPRLGANHGLSRKRVRRNGVTYVIDGPTLIRLRDGKREMLCRHPGGHEQCIETAEAFRAGDDVPERKYGPRERVTFVPLPESSDSPDDYSESAFP